MLSDSPCCACMKHSEVIRAIMLDDSPHVLHHEQRVPIPVVQHRLPVRRDICEHVFPQRIRTRVPLNAFSCEHVFPCVPLNAFAQARSGWEGRPGGSARVAGPRDKTERRHDGGTRRGLWVSLSLSWRSSRPHRWWSSRSSRAALRWCTTPPSTAGRVAGRRRSNCARTRRRTLAGLRGGGREGQGKDGERRCDAVAERQ